MRTSHLICSFFLGIGILLPLPESVYAGDSTSFAKAAITAKAPTGSVPVGTVIIWPFYANPAGWNEGKWLECNGQAVSASAYPELCALGYSTVPNFQGLFLRGKGSQTFTQNNGSTIGTTSTTHSSGNLRQVQGDAIRQIYGTIAAYGLTGWHNKNIWTSGFCGITGRALSTGSQARTDNSGEFDFSTERVTPTAEEIRPVNMAVRYLIRAKS